MSEYTDKIDIISYKDKSKRILAQLREVCAILSGLMVAHDYKEGQAMIKDRAFSENAVYFQKLFEISRRHKIRNPEKMRTAYGKMMYLLMDSQIPEVEEMLEFSLIKPIETVYKVLERHGALGLLREPLLATATSEIYTDGKTRPTIDREKERKEKACKMLASKYTRAGLSNDEVMCCIRSIADNNNYLRMNRDPVDKMIKYLSTYFNPDSYEDQARCLAISQGTKGARLTHGHKQQYFYVMQSMMLWREVLNDMFRLWCLAEDDMLSSSNMYRLRDTGQVST